jgi:UPF0755 protein
VKKKSLFLFLLLLLFFCAWLLHGLLTSADNKPQWKILVIPTGDSLLGVAGQLQEAGLVSSTGKKTFVTAAVLRGWRKHLQPGRYRLSPSLSPWQILNIIVKGKVYTIWVTIPEGCTLNQIGEKLEEAGLGSRKDFLALSRQPGKFSHTFPLPASSLEGYLFPDSYQIDGRQGQADMIQKMLNRFDEVVWQGLFGRQAKISDRSLSAVVTLASLVEAEAKQDQERAIIAGVLQNRLTKGMKLQCDATVQYALGQRKERLSYSDLKVDSPYNTYLYYGLPPGPINNPGRASMVAALHPQASPYLFYVARPDGSHIFSRTYAEHLAAISALRRN